MKFTQDNPMYDKYEIGRYTYGKPQVLEWGEGATLKIGSFCAIASEVTILLGGNHRTDWVTTYPFSHLLKEFKDIKGHPATKGDVVIGNDVWIGTDACILSGITIGDGAVIGAKTVVTKSVDPYTVVAGNPGRIIKKRFSSKIIKKLLAIQWWNWDIEKIKKHIPLMLDNDIEKFIQEVENNTIKLSNKNIHQ